jgi:hypothetical protein
VRDDFDDRKHLGIAAGVIVVLMRVEDVAERLAGNRLHLRKDVRMVAIEHVVDQDDTFTRDVHGNVAALARNHVQLALHLFQAQWTGWLGVLSVQRVGHLHDSNCGKQTSHPQAFHTRRH